MVFALIFLMFSFAFCLFFFVFLEFFLVLALFVMFFRFRGALTYFSGGPLAPPRRALAPGSPEAIRASAALPARGPPAGGCRLPEHK